MENFIEFVCVLDNELYYNIQLILDALFIEYKVNGNTFLVNFQQYHSAYKNINEFLNEIHIEYEKSNNEKIEEKINITFSYIIIFGFIAFYFFTKSYNFYFWLSTGANDAYKVINGEFWRCFTSLTLHKDILHITSNMIFLSILIKPVIRILNEGKAWFLILLSGFIGNILADLIYQKYHSSIGLSTAIFGIIGILSYHRYIDTENNKYIISRYLPFAAGIALFAFLGTGKDVDIIAHFTGFIAGILIAIYYQNKSKLFESINDGYYKVISLSFITFSWFLALFF